MLHVKSGVLKLDNHTMDYFSFGNGNKTLLMLPGLGDGLRTVKGTAMPIAWMYRAFAKQYTVFVFSRINELTYGYTTKDMARDVSLAMDALGIRTASVLGISLGGMIAQHLAADYPSRIEKAVLAVTLSKSNNTMQTVVQSWLAMAKAGTYKKLMIDTAEKSYSEAYLRSHRWIYPLMGLVGKPKDASRFIIQAESCLGHNAYDSLASIKCPTLVLGGRMDKIVGSVSSEEIAAQIPGSALYLFEGLGHAAYEEAKDFNMRVLDFLCGADCPAL